jgi:hypothetical protein
MRLYFWRRNDTEFTYTQTNLIYFNSSTTNFNEGIASMTADDAWNITFTGAITCSWSPNNYGNNV